MSQKLIEFSVYFYDCSYNVIACFYAEICTIYIISILQKLLAEMKILERIRSENKPYQDFTSRQASMVATKNNELGH